MAEKEFTVTQKLSETQLRANIQAVTEAINVLKTHRKTLLKAHHDLLSQTVTNKEEMK